MNAKDYYLLLYSIAYRTISFSFIAMLFCTHRSNSVIGWLDLICVFNEPGIAEKVCVFREPGITEKVCVFLM